MDVGWKRLHLLLCFLTFWKHAVGRESLGFQSVHPRSLHFQKAYSPPEVQSSMLNASVTGNIPLEVDSNVLGGNGTSPGRSRFSYLQFVKGGAPSGSASMSQAQSASSSSVSTSMTTPQNLSQPGSFSTLFHVQGSSTSSGNMAGQSVGGTGYNQYDSTSKDNTGLKAGGSSQLVSSTGGSGLSQSNTSQSAPGSFSALMYSPTVLSQAGSKSLNPSSQSSSGPHMGGITSWLFTSASQGSSRSPLTGSSSPLVSTQGGSASFSGLYQQSPSKSQSSPTYSSIGSLPLAVSRYPTSSQSLYSSGSQGSSYQFAASRPSGLAQGTSSQPGVSYVQSQGSLSQVAIGPPRSASLAAPQVPQKWLPSASSFSPGSQTSATALSQSSYSPQSAPAPSKPLSSVGLPSQVAPGLLYSSASMASPQGVLCQYDKAAENVNTLSQRQPLQRLQPSVSMSSPSIQTSSTVSQSSSLFEAIKTPSSFSPSSAGGPRPLVPMQGAGGYGGSAYIPGSSAYSKLVSSPLGAPSQVTSAQSSRDLSTSSFQSSVGTAQTVSSRYVSSQNGSTSTFGSSLQSQVASSQFGPAPSLDAKVPVYSQAPPVGTMYQSQPSLFWQPSTSKATDGSFSTSGAAVLQSSSSSQRVQAPSTSSSAGGASYPVSTQGSGSYSYSGLSLSPSTVLQYAPVSGMVGSPPLSVSSQSASGQSSPSQHTSLSQSRTGSLLTSSGSLSVPGGSGSSDGSSLLTQGTFCRDAPVPSMETRLPVFSQTKAVSSGVSLSQSQPLQSWQPSATGWRQVVQGSGSAALQSGSPPQSVVTSGGITFLPALSTPVDSVAQSSQTSSLLGFGSRPARLPSIASSGSVSNQMSPGVSVSLKLPTGSMTPGSTAQAASGGMSSAPSQALGDPYGASVGGQGMSSGLKSVLYSSYGSSSSQSGPVSYSQSAGGQSSPSQYASLSQSRTGSLLTPSGYLSVPGGSGSTGGTSLLAQGTFGKYTPVASMDTRFPVSQTKTVSSGASLSQSQPLQSWQPSVVRWSDVQASGTAALQSGSSQSAQTSGSISFLPASSTVDSVAQSSQTSSLLGFGSRPARLPSIASSGSVSNQMSPGVSVSLKLPTGSMTPGSTAQAASGMSSAPSQALGDPYGASVGGQGMSSGLKSVLYSSYGSSSQSGPISYSQSAGGQSSPSQYASLSQSRTGSLLTPSGYLSVPGGSGSTGGTSLLAQGTFGKYTPVASMDTRFPVSQTKTVSSGASLSQSQPLQSWQPSVVRWSDVQASGTAALQSGSSQSAQTSGSVSFLPASSTVDSVAQSSQTSSLLGFGSRPARLPSIASSGSVSNQMPPCVSASLEQPTGSMTPGSAAQGVSVSSQAQTPSDSVSYGAGGQGVSSGLKYMIQSSYGSSSQSGPVSYSPVSGSAGSQVSPGLFASLKLPTGSITRGSTAQPASGALSSPSQALGDPYGANVGGQGMSGSVSSGLTSVSSSYGSSYGQMDPVSKPSRGSLRQYYAVKG